MTTIIDAIKQRRSIRKYKKKQVPDDLIKSVLDAANWAPSSGNSQPWEFIVARGAYADTISKIFYASVKDHIPTASYIPDEKKAPMLEYAKDFGGAPVRIIVTYQVFEDTVKTEEALMATCAAIQNLCLAATQVGLGSVWIAGQTIHAVETRSILNLSEDWKIAGIIPVGFPDMNPPAPSRKDPELDNIVKWLGY